ncbi:hypothetical protein RQP46_001755 [Phenoliferia psychrophenolica]
MVPLEVESSSWALLPKERLRKPIVAVVAKKGKGRAKKGAKNVSAEDARRNTEPNLFIQVHGDPSLFPCVSYLVDPLVDEPSRPLRPVSTMHHSKAHHIVSSHAFVIPHHVVDARGTLEVGLGWHALGGPTKAAVVVQEGKMELVVRTGEWRWMLEGQEML